MVDTTPTAGADHRPNGVRAEPSVIQLLGWIGSILIVVSLTLRQPVRFRLVNLAASAVLLVFNCAIGLWSMVTLNIAILIVNLWQLSNLRRTGRPPGSARRGATVVQARPAEGWYTSTAPQPLAHRLPGATS
jgi:hypothetical protein